MNLPRALLARYVGKYTVAGEPDTVYLVSDEDGRLFVDFHFNPQRLELVPHGERAFSLRWTAADLDFDVRPDGTVAGLRFHIGGETRTATKVE